MPTFSTTRRVAFTPRQMFDLVADVEQYPRFLPLCEGLTVRKRERDGGNRGRPGGLRARELSGDLAFVGHPGRVHGDRFAHLTGRSSRGCQRSGLRRSGGTSQRSVPVPGTNGRSTSIRANAPLRIGIPAAPHSTATSSLKSGS